MPVRPSGSSLYLSLFGLLRSLFRSKDSLRSPLCQLFKWWQLWRLETVKCHVLKCMAESWQVVWVAVFISGHHNCVLHSLDCPGPEHVMSSPWLNYWTWHIKCPNPIWYKKSLKNSSFWISPGKAKHVKCIRQVTSDQSGQATAACPAPGSVGSQKISRPRPPATDHPPSCAVYCVCTSQAHYNADDTARCSMVIHVVAFYPIEY